MATITTLRQRAIGRGESANSNSWGLAAYAVSSLLAAVSAVGSAATFFIPGVLRGPAVMNGSARGTALVMLAIGLPALLVAMVFAARGSRLARIVWLGVTGYFVYNGVMFVLGTPLNQLYLVYVAMLGLSIWTAVFVVATIDLEWLRRSVPGSFVVRAIAVYIGTIAALNAVLWLAGAVPAMLSTSSPQVLRDMGLTTVPTYDQDLAFWIPLMCVTAVWMWRGVAWGRLIAGALLAMGALEGVGVAVDQWMGSTADPSSTVASAAVTPVFAVLALTEVIALFFYLRAFRGQERSR